MMKLFGWKKADLVSVYSYLSMRDVDENDPVIQGLKRKEDILRPLVQAQRCPKCSEENTPFALYCPPKCGGTLTNASRVANFYSFSPRTEGWFKNSRTFKKHRAGGDNTK